MSTAASSSHLAASSDRPSQGQIPGPSSQASQTQRTVEAKAAFTASLTSVAANIDTELQARARNIHANTEQLSKQEKDLQKETKNLVKQGDAMQKLVDRTRRELQRTDFGAGLESGLEEARLEDAMADLDRDLALIEETLRIVEEGSEGEEEYEMTHEDGTSSAGGGRVV